MNRMGNFFFFFHTLARYTQKKDVELIWDAIIQKCDESYDFSFYNRMYKNGKL